VTDRKRTQPDLVFLDGVADRVLGRAITNCQKDQQPLQESIARTQASLRENQQKIDSLVETITSSTASPDLIVILSEKAGELRRQREALRNELHRLSKALVPIEDSFDVSRFRNRLNDFEQVSRDAVPERLQKLLRLTVKNIKWQSDGMSEVDYYIPLDKTEKPARMNGADRFDINVRSGGPERPNFEPFVFGLNVSHECVPNLETAAICRIT
jgi:DNA repair exonuclease SbcCD ATPase subunit